MLEGIDDDDLIALTQRIKESRNKFGRDSASEEILCRNAALTIFGSIRPESHKVNAVVVIHMGSKLGGLRSKHEFKELPVN